VAMVASGALGIAAFMVAVNELGPLGRRALTIAERSGAFDDSDLRDRFERVRELGARSARLAGGYATGVAALSAFVLLVAFADVANGYRCSAWAASNALPSTSWPHLLAQCARTAPSDALVARAPGVFVGALVGASLAYLFCVACIR